MEFKLAELVSTALLAIFGVAVRLMFNAEKKTIFGVLRSLSIGLFVGYMVSMYLADITALGEGTKGAIIGASVVISEDLLGILISAASQIRKDPIAFFLKITGRQVTSNAKKTESK